MKQLGDLDLGQVIWRYVPLDRFEQLVRLSALWFSKLQTFEDLEEGMTPAVARTELKRQHREMEDWFPDEHRKQQVRKFVETNEEDGRELIVASCWFVSENEARPMWDKFARDGVAIRSSAGALTRSLRMSHDRFWVGKVSYIDPTQYAGMNAHEGSQAHLRAFLKNAKYEEENELRVATMNFVAPGCLNPDGSPPNDRQQSGLVYSDGRPGIYVTVSLPTLISEVRIRSGGSDHHREHVELLLRNAGCVSPVRPSELTD